jgi:hypothetical protein
MTTSNPSTVDGGVPLGLGDELSLLDNSATNDPTIPPVLPLDIILYSTSFIRPWMVGEMGLFHDKPISLILVLLVLESSPVVHLHFRAVFWAWGQGLFMT